MNIKEHNNLLNKDTSCMGSNVYLADGGPWSEHR